MPKSSKRLKTGRSTKRSVHPEYIIFVSHSSDDAWIARMMTEKIQAIGAKCWLDEKDLDGGDVIADHIIRGIDACHEAVVLISSNSVRSPWVSFEIGGVRAQHKRVTPILNKVRHDELALIKDIKSIDLNRFEQFLAQLERRIIRRRRKA